MASTTLLEALVWTGTITFAVAGGLQAVQRRFDLFGVLVLSAVTAVGGGSVRDIIGGRIPPPALTNEPLLWAVAVTGVLVAFLHPYVPTGRTLAMFDLVGLGVFAALGAEAGLGFGFGLWGTVFAGTVSGVGGGIVRDVLCGEVPGVLYRSGDFYASAASVGAGTVYLVSGPLGTDAALLIGTLVVVAVRVGSNVVGLRLPVPRPEPEQEAA